MTNEARRLILAAVAVVLFLSALDQTIVATALPRIIEELHGLSLYAWVTTAYLLTSTVSVPIYGRLSDQYGRKPILVAGVLLFLAGSVLCGLSGEFGELPVLGTGMTQLVLSRALQGLGGGALMTSTFAVIGDLYPPRERGRMFGLFGAVFGLATVIGPLLGGFFTDHGTVTVMGHEIAGWRWVFYLNLPLGLIALFLILFRMPALHRGGGGRVDYAGAALVVLTFTPLLLALSLGGTTYPWKSAPIIGLLLASGAAFAIFLWVEAHVADAILPLHLFRNRTFAIANLGAFVISMAFLGVVMFMPLYMQVVQGIGATQSGLALLPLMAGVIVSSIASGRLVTRTGRYKPLMVGGGVILSAGVLLLTAIGPDTTTLDLAWRLALTGIGLGPAQNLFSLVIQNAAPMAHLGTATSMSQFSRQIGATVGVAIFGTFLTHNLTRDLPRYVPLPPGASEHRIDLAQAQEHAMDAQSIRAYVDDALAERYALVERALLGDEAAAAEILADPRMPQQIKALLGEGGLRARVHDELEDRARQVVEKIESGPAGRDELLADPDLSARAKRQLERLPDRAFEDPQVVSRIASLFGAAVLEKEEAIFARSVQRALELVRREMAQYANRLAERIERGTKEAFAASIAGMLGRSVWIVLLGALIIALVPELPLRSQETKVADSG